MNRQKTEKKVLSSFFDSWLPSIQSWTRLKAFLAVILVLLNLRAPTFLTIWENAGGIYELVFSLVHYELKNSACLTQDLVQNQTDSFLQSFTKYMRQTLVFMWNSALRKKLSFYFSGVFAKYWKKILCWKEDWALVCNSSKFWDFPGISYFSKVLSRSATRVATSIFHVYYKQSHFVSLVVKRKFGLKLGCSYFRLKLCGRP